MKAVKFIIAVLIIAAVAAYFVWFKPATPEPTPADCYNLESVLAADFELAKAEAKEGETPVFYEAETVLNGPASGDEVKIISLLTVIQLKDRCMLIRHNEGAYTNAPDVAIADPGHWLGDWEIPMTPAPITFDQAVEKLKAWNGIIPTGDKMTFRRPQGGQNFENGLYIFGTMGTGFVGVDSVTGEIYELAAGNPFQVGALQEKPQE